MTVTTFNTDYFLVKTKQLERLKSIFLENNYLSSPQKLIEHKNTILSENYISLNISNIKILQENDGLITIKKFNKDE